MVSIHSGKQNDFIVNLVKASQDAVWIGGNRACDNCKDLIWSDGTSWDYNNWFPGEPNNVKEIERKIEMYINGHGNANARGKWNDEEGPDLQGFICKKSGESTFRLNPS